AADGRAGADEAAQGRRQSPRHGDYRAHRLRDERRRGPRAGGGMRRLRLEADRHRGAAAPGRRSAGPSRGTRWRPMSNGFTVLVVEDNPATRKMLRVTLATEGYSVAEAGDGRSALAIAEARLPDLVLQDLILPDLDGFELLRRLRALPGGSELPI